MRLHRLLVLATPALALALALAACANTTASSEDHDHSGSEASAIYSCPMHPEVKQDHPGSCPKCGMTLKAK
ncbi:hypothetical protein BH09MYX1_BH09MYX1_56230 [soil metagenome]